MTAQEKFDKRMKSRRRKSGAFSLFSMKTLGDYMKKPYIDGKLIFNVVKKKKISPMKGAV